MIILTQADIANIAEKEKSKKEFVLIKQFWRIF